MVTLRTPALMPIVIPVAQGVRRVLLIVKGQEA